MNELRDKLIEIMSKYPGAVIGSLVGLLCGLLIITFGLLKVILLFVCILVGIFAGSAFTRMRE